MDMHVVDLNDGAPHDPRPALAGPWQYLRLLQLDPGATERLPSGDVEYATYVVDGAGTAETGAGSFELRAGTSLVLLRGAGATLAAGDGGLRVFVEAVDAPAR
jgi:hypothetical protein